MTVRLKPDYEGPAKAGHYVLLGTVILLGRSVRL
jgi:hypothetical protein